MVEIRNRFTGEVICSGEKLAEAVWSNLKNLRSADLSGANLYNADLRGANLYNADLRGANLYNANLYNANLYNANLTRANLYNANLHNANLSCANLSGANLHNANLTGANLIGIKLAYQSHDLLAEILCRSAGDDIAKLKVAGLILIGRDKCWREFLAMAECEPLADWALDELAKWMQPDDGAPEILRGRAGRIAGGKHE